MLSKLITRGTRIELREVEKNGIMSPEAKFKIYKSRVIDILSEDTLEIEMPMEQTKLILLPVDSEYDLIFYVEGGLYQCFVRIVDRYKSNNVYILLLELTSSLRKYQRREYFRYDCAYEIQTRVLLEEEQEAIEKKQPYILQAGLAMTKGVIVDISGGGLRFLSSEKYEQGSLIYCYFSLYTGGNLKTFEMIGRIISIKEVENKPGVTEHRMEFFNTNTNTREEIIRFIFEEERKNRKRDRLP